MRKTPMIACECEHESHFQHGDNKTEKHYWGKKFPKAETRKVTTSYGTYTVCEECGPECLDHLGVSSTEGRGDTPMFQAGDRVVGQDYYSDAMKLLELVAAQGIDACVSCTRDEDGYPTYWVELLQECEQVRVFDAIRAFDEEDRPMRSGRGDTPRADSPQPTRQGRWYALAAELSFIGLSFPARSEGRSIYVDLSYAARQLGNEMDRQEAGY